MVRHLPSTELVREGDDTRHLTERHAPPVTWIEAWGFRAVAGAFVLSIAWIVVAWLAKTSLWPAFVLFAGMIACGMAIAAFGQRGRKRALQKADYLLCTYCAYPLQGLGDEGTCPECGRGFRAEAARFFWLEHEQLGW
jgi:hypothetical protein